MAASDERKGARTRNAILATAAKAFAEQGFDGATLDDIAAELGLGRSAVLHHFASKADLLVELVAPLLAKIDELLDRIERAAMLTASTRRELFVELVDLLAENRAVTTVVTRDLTAHPYLGADLQISDRAARFARLVTAAEADNPYATTRALAALGAVLRPLFAADDVVDLTDPANRALLVDCAAAVSLVALPAPED
jgi:AcrR family transcriptional regulator